MNLLLDIGNSRCKYRVLKDGQGLKDGVIENTENRLVEIKDLLQNNKPVEQAVICSVLSAEFDKKLSKLFIQNNIDNYYFLNPAVQAFGIQHCYQKPERLGADRLAAMIAANSKYNGHKCIVDCGTAVTIDVVNDEGFHQGGVIIPGISSMQAALSRETNIPRNDSTGKFDILSNSTQDAIYTGCVSAVAGGIQYVVDAMQKKGVAFDTVVITGGNAENILPMITHDAIHEPSLVLDGLTVVLGEL